MTKIKSPTTVKNKTRTAVFKTLCTVLGQAYGLDNVHRIGDTEIAVKVGEAPTGEPIYATFAPTVKDYCDRQTNIKTIKAFDLTAEVEAYQTKVKSREVKAAESAEHKAKKIDSDKARRKANAEAKAKAKADKAKALTGKGV